MKRILSLMLALLLLFCSFGCSKEAPENTEQLPADTGEIVTDGTIKYHTGQLIADIYPEENKINFTFDNQRDVAVYCSKYYVQAQKWENEQWTFYPLLVPFRDIPDDYTTLPAHKKSNPISIPIYPRAVTAGRYRLISKGGSDGSDTIYWMGEFSITEEQAAGYPEPGDLYYENGSWQSNAVSLSFLPATEEPYLYEFAVQNSGTGKLVLPQQSIDAWLWNEHRNEWATSTANWRLTLPAEKTFVDPGDTFRFPLYKEFASAPTDDVPPYNGYYRFAVECYWEEDIASPFVVILYFRSQDGVITEEKPPELISP